MIKASELQAAGALLRRMTKESFQVNPSSVMGGIETGLRGVGSLIRGTNRAVHATSAGAGKGLSEALGGGAGSRILGKAVEYSPYVAGGAMVNKSLDNPVGNFIQERLNEYRANRLQNAASFDPTTGQWT